MLLSILLIMISGVCSNVFATEFVPKNEDLLGASPIALSTYCPQTGSTTITTCSDHIYDNGGPSGNYAVNSNGYVIIYPAVAGNMISVSGTLTVEGGYDYMTIYNGSGTGGTILWGGSPHGSGTACTTFTVPTITSTSGPLTVRFYSDGSNQCSGFDLTITCIAPPPANDNCGSAIAIGALPYTSAIISNAGATNDVPTSTCDGPYKNIWWTVTGICGTMTANTCTGNTNFDSEIAVFTGACGSMTQVGCNDDACGLQSSVTWTATTSTTYYISVGSYYSGGTTGNIQLNVTGTPFALSTAPTSISGVTTICNGGSTTLTAVGGTDGYGAIYEWFAGSCGSAVIGTGISITVSPTSNTTYFVRRNGTCNTTTCASQLVTVNTLSTDPTNILGTTSICLGTPTTLTAVGGTDGTGANYEWFSGACGGTFVGTGINITVAPATNTTYFVRRTGTCNTTSCASTTVTINTPATTGLTNGDYIWSGNVSTEWNNPMNWLVYNGTNFAIAGTAPTITNNVFVRAYSTCATNVPTISITNGNAKNLTIESGKTLTMSNGYTLYVSGNWTNSGTFNSGNGTVEFWSSSNQTIAPNGSSFYNVNFNNNGAGSADFNISQPMIITGNSNLSDGIVYFSGSGSLTYNNGATSNQGTTSSFVDGLITKIGNNAFTFPTGDVVGPNIVQAPIAMSAPAVSSTITAQYFFTSPPNNWNLSDMCNPATLDHTSGVEYWELARTAGSGAYPNVTLYWKNAARSGIISLPDLVVAHYESCSGPMKWANMSGTAFDDGGGTGHITNNIPFTSYSPITFGTRNNNNHLPVSLLSFEGKCEDGKVIINWSTASETNNDYFIVKRSSDGINWDPFKIVYGAGNSNKIINYSAEDESGGDMYYLLCQVDFDGKETQFEPLFLSCSEISKISIHPNPTSDVLYIEANDAEVVYQLLNDKGDLVLSGKSKVIDMTKLSSGMYFLKIIDDKEILIKKVIKQ